MAAPWGRAGQGEGRRRRPSSPNSTGSLRPNCADLILPGRRWLPSGLTRAPHGARAPQLSRITACFYSQELALGFLYPLSSWMEQRRGERRKGRARETIDRPDARSNASLSAARALSMAELTSNREHRPGGGRRWAALSLVGGDASSSGGSRGKSKGKKTKAFFIFFLGHQARAFMPC